MKIRDKTVQKAEDMTNQLQAQAQAELIKTIMEEEEVDYETAWAIALGNTDPVEYEYTLGFKLANPVLQLALFNQLSKKARKQAAENFAMQLSDPEREIFYSQIFNEETAGKFKKALKDEKKKKGCK